MIKHLSFQFQLFDENNQPIKHLPVFIQYYNMQENQWISIYNDNIIDGKLFIEEKATSRAKALKIFLGKIEANEIPELRIVPEKPIFNLKKQEVLSITYEFEFSQQEGILRFDFGSAWIMEKELLAQNDRYKSFYWITSPISLVNQRDNIAIIADLNKKLTACNKKNDELVQKNDQLEATVLSFSQQLKQCEASKKELEKHFNEQIKKLQAEINGQSETITELNIQLKQCEASKKELEKRFNEQIKKLQAEIDSQSKTIKDLINQLKQCEASKKEIEDRLNEQIKELKAKIDGQSETITDLNNKLKQCEASKKELEKRFNEQIQELEAEINGQSETIRDLNIQLKQCEALKEEIEKRFNEQIKKLQAEIDGQSETITDLNTKLKQCVASKKEIEDRLNEQIKELQAEINGQSETITDLNNQLIHCEASKKELEEDFNKQIKKLQNQINVLQAKLVELGQEIIIEDRPIAVKSIYKNLVQELDDATTLSKSNNYSLANLSIKLKGVISQDVNNNINVQFLTKENANKINGNFISDISFDIIPTPTQTFEAGKTPDILGLTETAVTRILDSQDLKLNPVYQNNPNVPYGASFKQSPQKDIPINPNEFVTVIFSKNE